MEKFSLSAFFNKYIFHYTIKCIYILLILVIYFCFSAKIYAEESLSVETGKSDQRGFESRVAKPEPDRSEEHTSELQSLVNLVCRLLLEKKKLI